MCGLCSQSSCARNKISAKAIVNINTSNAVIQREGYDVARQDSRAKGSEFTFKQNTFFTVQVAGEHSILKPLKFKWYGSFSLLDGYIPDQRRLLYLKNNSSPSCTNLVNNACVSQSAASFLNCISSGY